MHFDPSVGLSFVVMDLLAGKKFPVFRSIIFLFYMDLSRLERSTFLEILGQKMLVFFKSDVLSECSVPPTTFPANLIRTTFQVLVDSVFHLDYDKKDQKMCFYN